MGNRSTRISRVLLLTLLGALALPPPARSANLVEVRAASRRAYTRVVFELDRLVGYRLDRCSADHLVVSMGTQSPPLRIEVDGDHVEDVEIEFVRGVTTAHVRLRDPAVRAREMLLPSPPRIVIDFERGPPRTGDEPVYSQALACLTEEPIEEPLPAPPQILPEPAEPAPELAPSEPEEILVPELAVQEPEASHSRISDLPSPLRTDEVPGRPRPLLEIGAPFLGSGAIWKGFQLPTGAVLQPSLLLFGTSRLAVQGTDNGRTSGEAVARLDLFANLQLTGTERILVGVRPLDEDGKFTGYTIYPKENRGRQRELNGEIRTLFFEGDVGEMLPLLDPGDSRMLDIGFSVGRQELVIQEGLLIDDTLDSVGVVRNNLLPPGASNLRMTALYAWDEIHRGDNREDRDAQLAGLFTQVDLPLATLDVDAVYVDSETGGDAAYAGLSSVQRIHSLNTAVRLAGSLPTAGETPQVGRGALLFSEVSWTPPEVDDLLYVNGFYGLGEFSSAARSPDAGGPLGRTGILFSAYGIGALAPPLGNGVDDAAGGAIGYQAFLGSIRRQLVLELGGRSGTRSAGTWQIGAGVRYQQALFQRHVLQLDAAVSESPNAPVTPTLRAEWRVRF